MEGETKMKITKNRQKNKTLIGKRIGILGKGGSGKSTITVLLAKALRDSGYQVCVLDADSTNIGLHQALGFKKSPEPLMDYFGGTEFSGGSVSCPVDNPTPLPKSEVYLDELSDKYYSEKQGLFLLVSGKIGDKGPGAGCDGPISKITRDFKIKGIENCVTLIDVKAGMEETGRGITTGMDWLITVVDPTTAAIQIAEDIKRQVQEMKAGKLPDTKHLGSKELVERANKIFREATVKKSFAVLNKISDKKTEKYLKEKLKKKGIEPIGVVQEDSSISRAWLEGKSLEGIKAKISIEKVIKRLEAMNI